MKRYILFLVDKWNPVGGLGDAVGSYTTLDACIQAAAYVGGWQRMEALDRKEGKTYLFKEGAWLERNLIAGVVRGKP